MLIPNLANWANGERNITMVGRALNIHSCQLKWVKMHDLQKSSQRFDCD